MTRTDFPPRREGQAFSFSHDGLEYRVMVNRFPTGDIGEVFLDAGKVGTTAYNVCKEMAVVFSIARRYGVPLDVIRSALPLLESGEPAGPMGAALKTASGGE